MSAIDTIDLGRISKNSRKPRQPVRSIASSGPLRPSIAITIDHQHQAHRCFSIRASGSSNQKRFKRVGTVGIHAVPGHDILCKVETPPELIVIRTPKMLAVVGVRRRLKTKAKQLYWCGANYYQLTLSSSWVASCFEPVADEFPRLIGVQCVVLAV